MQKQIQRAAYHDFEEALALVENGLGRALKRTPPVIRLYTEHLAKSQGKLLRSRGLLACALNDENRIHENALRVSVGIEILHLATLVHDDVIDNAAIRRGQPTLQKQFGKQPAVICGDYLLCMAMKEFSQIVEKDKYREFSFPDYVSRLCTGELRQQENSWNTDISWRTCMKIIRGKTAALFEGAFRAGAILAADTDREAGAYARLGRYAGMIFQLGDDCLDYMSEESRTRKPVRSDYEQGVFTIPLVYSLGLRPEMKKRIKAGRAEKGEVLELVKACGGAAYTRELAGRYYKKAEAIVESLTMTAEKKQRVLAILDQAYAYGVPVPEKRRRDT